MYVNSKQMLQDARNGGYAVGAFNVENAEMVWAVIAAAEEMRAPVIIQTTSGTLKYLSPDYFAGMVQGAAAKATVPIALHLDHGSGYGIAQDCVEAGYKCVMIDGSALSFEENIDVTKKVCQMCDEKNIPVEAELGVVGGKEDDTQANAIKYTDPAQAKEFVRRTGVASLAVAVGTAHGFYKETPQLQFELIRTLREQIDVPLVLHGASGLPDHVVSKAIELGMSKVNFATELRAAYSKGVKATIAENPDVYDPKQFGTQGRLCVKELVKKKILLCGSANKADI